MKLGRTRRRVGMTEQGGERERLLEILRGSKIFWQDDALPDGGRLRQGSGLVEYLIVHEDGSITFSCDGWSAKIGEKELLKISGQCVLAQRMSGSGRQWLCVYAPIDVREEAVSLMREYIQIS
jgi:hypothetical protein